MVRCTLCVLLFGYSVETGHYVVLSVFVLRVVGRCYYSKQQLQVVYPRLCVRV